MLQRSQSTPEARKVLDADGRLANLMSNRMNATERRNYWKSKISQVKDEIKDMKRMLLELEGDLPKAVQRWEREQAKLKDARWAVRERRRGVLRHAYAKAHNAIRTKLGLPNLQSIDQMITAMEREDNENNGLIQDNPGDTGPQE